MSLFTDEILNYLLCTYSKERIKDLFKSYKNCSYDAVNQRYLVNSSVDSINYDLLTEWLYKGKIKPQSADTMNFSQNDIYFIEFKSGNQVKSPYKTKKLIDNVIGKINDSDHTFYSLIYPYISEQAQERIKLHFYLVVDTKEMGISAYVTTLAKLSFSTNTIQNPSVKALLEKVLSDLKSGVTFPDHFKEVGIWYSELFDSYLSAHGIKSISSEIVYLSKENP